MERFPKNGLVKLLVNEQFNQNEKHAHVEDQKQDIWKEEKR
jgi:hypothetical protein